MTTVSPSPPPAPPPPPAPASRPPVVERPHPLEWCRDNLFSNWFSGLVTILTGLVLLNLVQGFWTWSTTEAQWRIIPANFHLILAGRFPPDQYWRLWLLMALLSTLAGLTWGWLGRRSAHFFRLGVLVGLALAALLLTIAPAQNLVPPQLLPADAGEAAGETGAARLLATILSLSLLVFLTLGALLGRLWDRWISQVSLNPVLPIAWPIAFLISLWLIRGGLGLPVVSTSDWSGLLLTVFLALISIILCFPLGVLLALGRQSSLPAIRWL
ncbi:MAG: hypothetical protein ACO4AI_10950, partial [Prochlorothrix sp.]